jgi:hypothetical protein
MDVDVTEHPGVALLKSKQGNKEWLSLTRHMAEERIRDHASATCEGDDAPEEEWLSTPERPVHVQPSLQQSLAHRLIELLVRKLKRVDQRAQVHLDRMTTIFGHVSANSEIELHVHGVVAALEDGEFWLVRVDYEIFGVTRTPTYQAGSLFLRYQPG